MNNPSNQNSRVIGLDAHPDSFTAAMVVGATPAQAIITKTFDKIPIGQLAGWAEKNTKASDTIVLEASGNSFQIARQFQELGRTAIVLESAHLGRLKEAHANNDKISAVRIAKAYLAGTAKKVWVPDLKTQARRDLFHMHRKSVGRTTQMRNRLRSYLSDNGVRLAASADLLDQKQVLASASWSAQQQQIIAGFYLELHHAEQQRQHWESVLAQQVLADPELLALTRLCGIRHVIAFSLGAVIGDIHRFASPKNLVKYVGLNPAFDDSGEGTWTGGIGGHGRKDLRSLLIEAAQSILRSRDNPTGKWGRQLMARKSSPKLAVAAVARKLTVAIWYLMKGLWHQLKEVDPALTRKVSKMITSVGPAALQNLGQTRMAYREEIFQKLKAGRIYVLDPKKTFPPTPPALPEQADRVSAAKAL